MATWNFPKLSPGASLAEVIRIDYHNALRDALRWVSTQMNSGRRSQTQRLAPPDGTIWIKNLSGSDRGRFEILGIDDALITPGENLAGFQQDFPLNGDVPRPEHVGRFAILQEPIPQDGIGVGMVCGITPVQLDSGELGNIPLYADCHAEEAGKLFVQSSGSCQVLYKISDSPWALVRIGNFDLIPLPFELFDAIVPADTNKHAWDLKADLTRDESADKILISDGIRKDTRAHRGARGWYVVGPDGKNQIIAMQRQAILCQATTSGSVATDDTTFSVASVTPLDDGQAPAFEGSLSVANWIGWQCSGATSITIEADGSGGWKIAAVPMVSATVLTDVDYDASTGQLRKKTRSINCWATGAESDWTPYTTALEAGSDEQRDPTTTSLGLDASSVTYGTPITLTATVAHTTGTGDPTGEFAFFDGLPVGTPQAVGSSGTLQAQLVASLPVGEHSLTAVYGGDGTYNGSTSDAASATVAKMDTSTTISSSASTTAYGDVVTLTADVTTTNENPNCLPPSGKIEFLYQIGSGAFVSLGLVRITGMAGSSGHPATATASLALATLPAGSLTIKATYIGDANYNSSNGTAAQTVNKVALLGTVQNATKVYGDANPAFAIVWTGFVRDDTAAVVSGDPAYTCAATTSSTVAGGPYAISAAAGTLAADNYSFTFASGSLTITAAPLTITADDASMAAGDALPALTGSVAGIVAGDSLPFLGSTTANSSSPAGTYTITAGVTDSGSRLANYTVTTHDGTLTIT